MKQQYTQVVAGMYYVQTYSCTCMHMCICYCYVTLLLQRRNEKLVCEYSWLVYNTQPLSTTATDDVWFHFTTFMKIASVSTTRTYMLCGQLYSVVAAAKQSSFNNGSKHSLATVIFLIENYSCAIFYPISSARRQIAYKWKFLAFYFIRYRSDKSLPLTSHCVHQWQNNGLHVSRDVRGGESVLYFLFLWWWWWWWHGMPCVCWCLDDVV